ncbi:hypothetical protein H4R21_005982, partial [Coemansia helicoidea]
VDHQRQLPDRHGVCVPAARHRHRIAVPLAGRGPGEPVGHRGPAVVCRSQRGHHRRAPGGQRAAGRVRGLAGLRRGQDARRRLEVYRGHCRLRL